MQAALKTAVVMAGFGVKYVGAKVLARRLETRLDLPEVYRRQLKAPLAPDYEIPSGPTDSTGKPARYSESD